MNQVQEVIIKEGDKMDDYNFILAIKDLKTIPKICKELEIDYTNLIKGRSTAENEKKVASILKLEI